MDHHTAVFASVFPVLKSSTPLDAVGDGIHGTHGLHNSHALHTPHASHSYTPHTHAQTPHASRANRRAHAWSAATRFLGLPKDITTAPRLHRTRDVDDALTYLLLGEGRSHDTAEEGLLDWYTNECRLHFGERVRPGVEARWSRGIPLKEAWVLLEDTQKVLERAQAFYREAWDEHVLPVLKESVAGGGGVRHYRATQVLDREAVAAADWRFYRDVHALFAHCLDVGRFEMTLGFVLFDAGCKLFRIYTRPDGMCGMSGSARELKKRLTALLQGLERVGLGGEAAQKAFAHAMTRLLDSFIASQYLKVDWYASRSIVPHLRLWIRDGFCPLAEIVLECLRCENSSILPTEVTAWQEMALGRLGRARVDNLFDFVINWNKSKGAILDVKEYLKVPGAKQHLTSSFSAQISRRLLHPGATTTYILNIYIAIIRSFHELEPKGVLLERVARPIRRYLKERDDTARIIISSLLTDLSDETGSKFSSNSELSYEIASEMAKPFANLGQEPDEELNWNDLNWQPLPQDASPEYKKSKVEDVIWFLLTLWERDDFINELKNILGDHLLRCQDPEFTKEIRLLELIKLRLGDDKLQACEVMLRDVLDSRRINASIHALAPAPTPSTPQPRKPPPASADRPPLNAQILSSFFWPELRDDTFHVPTSIASHQKAYESRFERIKGMRKLRWLNALGTGSVTLELADRTESFDGVQLWVLSVIDAFAPLAGEAAQVEVGRDGLGMRRTVGWLEDKLEMETSLVRHGLAFWVGKSILRSTSSASDEFAVLERLDTTNPDDHAAADAQEQAQLAEPVAIKSQADVLEEKRSVYEAFIVGMLTAQGNMPVARIAMMMRMMVQGGFPFGEGEVEGLMKGLEGKGKVVGFGGGVWGVRK